MNRQEWYERLTRLLPAQFEEIIFRLGIPASYLPGANAPQAARVIDLVRYVESAGPATQARLEALLRGEQREAPGQTKMAAPDPSDATGERPEVVVLTALGLEYQAVRGFLRELREDELPTGTVVELGRFAAPTRAVGVAMVEMGAGNHAAAGISQELISHYRPAMVLLVGIAGGIKDVRLGDVVAATKVYGYESGKAGDEFLPRPDVGQSSYRLVQRARAEARRVGWLERLGIKGESGDAPRAFVGPIAAGSSVVASTRSAVSRFLRHSYSDTLAVEMEGRGVLETTHRNSSDALIVRGISDLIDDKARADAAGTQQVAARNAAAFAFEVIARMC